MRPPRRLSVIFGINEFGVVTAIFATGDPAANFWRHQIMLFITGGEQGAPMTLPYVIILKAGAASVPAVFPSHGQ